LRLVLICGQSIIFDISTKTSDKSYVKMERWKISSPLNESVRISQRIE